MAKKSTVHKIRKMEFKKIMIALLALFWIFVLFANDVTNFSRIDRLKEAQIREELVDESKAEETESVRDAWDVFDEESSVSSARESETDSTPAVNTKAVKEKAEKGNGFNIVVFMAWLMVIVLSVMAVAFVDGSTGEDFLALAVVLGLPTIFLTPFPMPIDETTHFFRCYMMSRGHILQVTNKAGLVGDYVPAGLAAILRHPENQLTLRTLTEHFDYWTVSVNGAMNTFYENGYASYYLPVGYVPAAVGLIISRVLHMPFFAQVYMGRFTNFLTYIGLAYAAYKKAPCYRNVFFIVGLASGSVYLAGSFSTDPLLIGCSLLYIAVILKHYFVPPGKHPKVPISDCAILVACAGVILSMKVFVYTPILLLILLIPTNRFGLKRFIPTAVAILAVAAFEASWQVRLFGQFTYDDKRLTSGTDVYGQMAFVRKYPVLVVRMIMNWLDKNVYYLTGSIKSLQESAGVAAIARFTTVLPFFTVFFTEDKPAPKSENVPGDLRRSCFILFAVEAVLIVLSLYIISSDMAGGTVTGVQSRYFLPIQPLLLLGIAGIGLDVKMHGYGKFVGYAACFSILSMLVVDLALLL